MKELLLKLVTLLHTLFVIFVVITPFTNSTYLLFLHFVVIPFIIIHWLLNNNTCALTLMEKKLRKELYKIEDDNECFTCKLIEPVYDFKKNYSKFSKLIYFITITLWLGSTWKLIKKYRSGEINNYTDLFIL